MPHSSRFAASHNLTFRVMGGKRGKKRQRGGKVGGKNGKVWPSVGRGHAVRSTVARKCGWRASRDVCGCQGASDAGWRHVDRTNLPRKVADVKKVEARGNAWLFTAGA